MEAFNDEQLDHLADRFISSGILQLCSIPFHQYILYPIEFDRMAASLHKAKLGGSIKILSEGNHSADY